MLLSSEVWISGNKVPPTLQEGGKRLGHSLSAASAAGHSPSHLLFLQDKISGRCFLINTGAEVSIIPPTAADRRHKPDLGLKAVYGSSIPTYGTRPFTDLGLRRMFRWIFIIADIRTPIIGADFLREYGLLVNLKHGHLLDATTSLQTKGTISHVVSPSPSQVKPSRTYVHNSCKDHASKILLQIGRIRKRGSTRHF